MRCLIGQDWWGLYTSYDLRARRKETT